MAKASELFIKTPLEEKLIDFNFGPKLNSGEVIVGAPVITHLPATSPDLTHTSAVVIGVRVQSEFAAGKDKSLYDVACDIETNTGQKLRLCGSLLIAEC